MYTRNRDLIAWAHGIGDLYTMCTWYSDAVYRCFFTGVHFVEISATRDASKTGNKITSDANGNNNDNENDNNKANNHTKRIQQPQQQ